MLSAVNQGGKVSFPKFTGEKVYMREFTKAAGLPKDLHRRQDTVDAMLDGIKSKGAIYIMVDQAHCKAGSEHRRPGLHVDGNWNKTVGGWDQGKWVMAHGGGHVRSGTKEGQLLILASSAIGCAAYVGEFEENPADGGDCSHIRRSMLVKVEMEPNYSFSGNALTMLHESLKVQKDCLRTVVRLNVEP